MSKLVEENANRFVSTLKLWKIVRLTPTKLGIQCPDKECAGKAVVSRSWLKSRPNFIGRSCTYCFKTFQIPEEMR